MNQTTNDESIVNFCGDSTLNKNPQKIIFTNILKKILEDFIFEVKIKVTLLAVKPV